MTALVNETDPMLEEYSYDSMFGPAEVFSVETDEGEALRVLYVDGGFQSATYLGERRFDAPFAYCRAFDVMFEGGCAPKDVLLIGGGAYSYPKHALTRHEGLSMDVIEIDPVVIDIARKHFFLDELEDMAGNRLRSFACDGMDFLRNAPQASYDAIVNDSFAGTVQDVPTLSEEGLALARKALRPGGRYLLNAVAEDDEGNQDEETLQAIECALRAAFDHVEHDPVEDDGFAGCVNHIFVAFDEAAKGCEAVAGERV